MTDKEIWLAAYLAAIAGGHYNPWEAARTALKDYRHEWGCSEQSEDDSG